jgi:hypothetical protein
MNQSIQIQNFKAFRKTEAITLGPITVLCGPNSAGKSSIIQALLMIRQSMLETQSSISSSGERQPLILNGQLTKLGSWSNVIHGQNINETLNITISKRGPLADWYAQGQARNPRLYFPRNLRDEYDVKWSLSIKSLQNGQVEVSQYIDSVSIQRANFPRITITKENAVDPSSAYRINITDLPTLIRSQIRNVSNLPDSSPARRFTEAIARIQPFEFTSGSLIPNFHGAILGTIHVTTWHTWRLCLSELISRIRGSRRGTRGPEPRYVAIFEGELRELNGELRDLDSDTDQIGPDRERPARNIKLFVRTLNEMTRVYIQSNMSYSNYSPLLMVAQG